MSNIAFLSLVNDRAQFADCQASLRAIAQPFPEWLMVEPNQRGWNAAQGLNHGLDRLPAEWVVCVHQDVKFPADFWTRLQAGLAQLPAHAAVAGVVGCEASGQYRGHIVDPNGHCYWPALPAPVLTLDEVLLAVRKSSGLRFSPEVPGFHCYGADLCLQAAARGLGVYAIDAPLVHLSTGRIDAAFEQASRWLLEKWGTTHGHVLPTPALLLQDEAKARLWKRVLQRLRRRKDRLARNLNVCPDPLCAARALAVSPKGGLR
ncbi:MAG: hypothetical protein JNK15_07645 [Planctomycetes bacterium]|nr:hypothetical protein [Planctomycetota bacterium]